MAIDYKKELETAARRMILVHNPEMLIKMIVRTIVQKVRVTHAGILLESRDKTSYVLTVSRGPTGLKIPAGFARVDLDNPLVRFFKEEDTRLLFKTNFLVRQEIKKILRRKSVAEPHKNLLKKIIYQMEIFQAVACIPSYFRAELLGVLLLGSKRSGKNFQAEELDLFSALASHVSMAIRNAQLFQDLAIELDKNKKLFINTTLALTTAIDAKDHYTHGHTTRVTEISLEIARQLRRLAKFEMADNFFEQLHIAALLHDIGKIGIPESILNKEGPLNEEERKRIKEHSLIGVTILQSIKELGPSLLGVKYHHERYDGSGYPEGLKADKIPLIAAIISVADAFDAMTTDRPYRRALSKEEAIGEIERQSGRQFHPEVAAALSQLRKQGKI
jgi:HD-GYP domain-containing protein (c-di-GMP phosphodiesterase class II)